MIDMLFFNQVNLRMGRDQTYSILPHVTKRGIAGEWIKFYWNMILEDDIKSKQWGEELFFNVFL
jgi:hypothetical protein